jgi:hypothetical protein
MARNSQATVYLRVTLLQILKLLQKQALLSPPHSARWRNSVYLADEVQPSQEVYRLGLATGLVSVARCCSQ